MSELVCRTLDLLGETKGGFVSAIKNIFNTKTMATLKISDLSVGDWINVMTEKLTSLVLCKELEITRGYIHSKIKGIREDGFIAVETADSRYTLVDIGCIGPIPITAEILEQNGFTRRSSEFPIYEHTTLLGKMLRTIVVSLLNPYDYIFCRIEDISKELHEDGRCLVSSNVSRHPIFVHDLQHALRLAELDKEINL